jgi:hypothetical protein
MSTIERLAEKHGGVFGHGSEKVYIFGEPEIAALIADVRRRAMEEAVTGDRFLSPADLSNLTTFYDQLNDGDADGFTLRKESRERLTELGCIYKSGKGLWSPTAFGAWLVESDFEQNPSLPLRTVEEYNSLANEVIRARLEEGES